MKQRQYNWLCVLRPCLFFALFLCMFLPAFAIFFFSFVLSFSLCCRCFFVYSLFPLPTRFKVHHRVSSIGPSDSHTHIRKINSHSRLLKVKISSGVVLGDCRVLGFATSVCRFTLFSTHSLIASSMQASSFYLSAVSHWW